MPDKPTLQQQEIEIGPNRRRVRLTLRAYQLLRLVAFQRDQPMSEIASEAVERHCSEMLPPAA